MPNPADQCDRSVLTPPDPPFAGEIEVALEDSKADFPEPLRAPDGAPNADRRRRRHRLRPHECVRRAGAYADLRPAGRAGPEVHELPRHGRLLGRLSVDDKQVAEGRIDKTVPVVFSTDDTFDVGEDRGTPVSPVYKSPFRFTGSLKQVTVEAK
jgi:hypothetical protein